LDLGKPTLLLVINGGIVSFDELVDKPKAIIEGFYPSVRGAEAIAISVFG
jgi:hypothetical protein